MAHSSVTPEKRREFLAALAECGNVSESAETAAVCRRAIYRLREDDEEFREHWRRALEIGTEGLEDEARRRAYRGVEEPVYQGGVLVGKVQKYSDTLLIFLLKGAKPEVYKDRVANKHYGRGGGPIDVAYHRFAALPADKLAAIEDAIEAALAEEQAGGA
jgi:hypothetical protein